MLDRRRSPPRATVCWSASACATSLTRPRGRRRRRGARSRRRALRREDGVERGEQRRAVGVARREIAVAGIREEVGALDRRAQALPEVGLGGGDGDVTVARRERLEGHDRWVGAVGAASVHVSVRSSPRSDVHQLAEGRLEQRDVGIAAGAVALGAVDRRRAARSPRRNRRRVDQRQAALGRRRVGSPVRLSSRPSPGRCSRSRASPRTWTAHAKAVSEHADDHRVDLRERVDR